MRNQFRITERAKALLIVLLISLAALMIERPMQAQTIARSGPTQFQTYSTRVSGVNFQTARSDNLTCAGSSCPTGTYRVQLGMQVDANASAGTGGVTVTLGNGTSSNTVSVSSVAMTSTTTGFATATGLLDYTSGQTATVALTTSVTVTGTGLAHYTVSLQRVR